MARPKTDPVDRALDVYLGLEPDDREVFRRVVERIGQKSTPASKPPRKRTKSVPAEKPPPQAA